MLFFNRKNKAEEEAKAQQAAEEQHAKEVNEIKESYSDLPLPTILPMIQNKVNGEDVADDPEDTVTEERKRELADLLFEPELDFKAVEQMPLQEVLFLMLTLELYNKVAPLDNFQKNHRILYNEVLARVRDAKTVYVLFDRRTTYPFLYNGCVCIYLNKEYAQEAVQEFKKILRELEVRELPGEGAENNAASVFAYLNFLGMNMLLIDNGKYRCRFRREEIRVDMTFGATEEEKKAPTNPALAYALCDFLQEARWPVSYEKRQEVLKEKEKRMLDLLQKGTFMLPFTSNEEGKRGVLTRKDKNGKQFLAIFSDEVELAKERLPQQGQWRYQKVPFNVLPAFMGNLEGAILNPNGHRIVISAAQFKKPETEEAAGAAKNAEAGASAEASASTDAPADQNETQA